MSREKVRREINYDNIPEVIKALDQWVLYDKSACPINAKTLTNGKTSDPTTWVSYETVVDTYKRALAGEYKDSERIIGIGFVFCGKNELIAIDLDNCIDKDGNLNKIATSLVKHTDTYVEKSPTGTGLHFIFKNPNQFNKISRTSFEMNGQDFEVYHDKRYFTITGNKLGESNDNITSNGAVMVIKKLNKYLGSIINRNNIASRVLTGNVNKDKTCSNTRFSRYTVLAIEHALTFIEGDSEGDWYNRYTRGIARAADENPEYHDELKAIWDKWSSLFDGYDEIKNDSRWERAKRETIDITIGTLFDDAKNVEPKGWVRQQVYEIQEVDDNGEIGIHKYTASSGIDTGEILIKEAEIDLDKIENLEKSKEENIEMWENITQKTIETAIAGSYLGDICNYFRMAMTDKDGKPLPLAMVFGKALALCGAILAAPSMEYKQKIATDKEDKKNENDETVEKAFKSGEVFDNYTVQRPRGIDNAKFVFGSAGGMTTNIFSLLLADSGAGKDVGGYVYNLAPDLFLTTGTMTPEGLLDSLPDNGNGILLLSEFESFLKPSTGERMGLKDCLTMLFNKGYFDQQLSRRNKGSEDRVIDYGYPSVIASLQPEVFKKYARTDYIVNGCLTRFLITHCKMPKTRYGPTSEIDKSLLKLAKEAVSHFYQLKGSVKPPKRYLDELYGMFEDSSVDNGLFCRLINEYAPKIACILQADAQTVTDDTWDRTSWILRDLFSQSYPFVSEVHTDDFLAIKAGRSDKIYQYILSYKEGCTLSQLNKCSTYKHTDNKDKCIQDLINGDLIKSYPVLSKGTSKPTTVLKAVINIQKNKKKIWQEKLFDPIQKFHIIDDKADHVENDNSLDFTIDDTPIPDNLYDGPDEPEGYDPFDEGGILG